MEQEKGRFASPGYLYRTFRKQLLAREFDIIHKDRIGNSTNRLGFYDPSVPGIILRRNQTPQEAAVTTLHEMMHDKYPTVAEEEIENGAISIYEALKPSQQGFFQFIASEE